MDRSVSVPSREKPNRSSVVGSLQERLAKLGLVVVASSQSGLTDVLQRDVPKWGKAVKNSGVVAE
jgi:hypothetical protein